MNKAFIFDLDGVIIDDETIWEEAKKEIYTTVFGREVYSKLGSTLGINIDGIYERAIACGSNVSKEKLFDAFYQRATAIYQTAPLTPGLQPLVDNLLELNYVLGIVSSSPRDWIDTVLERTTVREKINLILSLLDRPDLKHKPDPDGYLEAIKEFKSKSESTIVLEDSNAGITSAKAAGAYTIGFKQNLVKGYRQKGADIYADTFLEVEKIVRQQEDS